MNRREWTYFWIFGSAFLGVILGVGAWEKPPEERGPKPEQVQAWIDEHCADPEFSDDTSCPTLGTFNGDAEACEAWWWFYNGRREDWEERYPGVAKFPPMFPAAKWSHTQDYGR